MISEWMDQGNINEYVKTCEGVNRLQLVNRVLISWLRDYISKTDRSL